jgi:predicted lipoprotein with Yx(FWY)xxD motif
MRLRFLAAAAAALSLGVTGSALVGTAGASGKGARVTAHSSKYGRVLFTGQNRSIYLFARDHGKSTCYGACAKAWPPVLTKGKPVAGAGVKASLLGTVRRKDGSKQVTYAGHPLYRFVKDTKAFQITCQNVSNFGAKWLVITPAGKVVR